MYAIFKYGDSMETLKTRVISLSHCVDRRERMRQQLDSIEIEFTFFDAVDGTQTNFPLADKRNDALTIKRLGYTLSDSELACYASHYLLWQECITENRALLVLEDNAQLQSNFRQVYARLPDLAEQYAFLKLSCIFESRNRAVAQVAHNLNIVRYFGTLYGTSCYLLTPSAARIFIARSKHFTQAVDNFMERPWLGGVPCYALLPWPTVRSEAPSVIGDRRGTTWPLSRYGKARVRLFHYYEQTRRWLFFYFGW